MKFLIFLKNADEVIRIHDNLIQKFGGRPGILHKGLLESAVNHPHQMAVDRASSKLTTQDIAELFKKAIKK